MTATTRQRRHNRASSEETVRNDDDDAWEDVDGDVGGRASVSSRSPKPVSSRARPSPRKRTRNKPIPSSSKTETPPPPPMPSIQPVVIRGSIWISRYTLDVLTTAVNYLRGPLSFIVFIWMLAFLVQRMTNTIRVAFAPICWLPLVSQSPFCLPPSAQQPQWADFPKLVDVQSATLEQLLEESTSGSTLALQLKKAEIATSDLVTLVTVSDLKSRDVIQDSLRTFIDDARAAGRSLNRLNAKVSGAVDGVVAVNDYALRTIEGAHAQHPPSMLQQILRWPFKPQTDIVVSAFEDSMNYLSLTMSRLVIEFELNLNHLNKLEEQLSVLHELVSREDKSLTTEKAELLGYLWTKLGGNRPKLRGYDNHLALLKGLGEYRKQALAHVVGALQTLAQMSEDIENLRERVAAPELVGGRIPLEVHIRSIQGGLERLNEGRSKAKFRESEAVKRILGIDM
ncbi:hypothetical protein MIND_00345000 [Mycena indigotica]|uniref:Uncharacterized protein n=1 Tax=Mycena indigotica TaxID=2126181 RepID=A0A8H6T4F4_9AGAR|nr:uncharacterized protein MIND_00345000 [Mycena indigotica]KAF7309732.1 hypothetical protein MIND_00345000 [Mycena indigotica]